MLTVAEDPIVIIRRQVEAARAERRARWRSAEDSAGSNTASADSRQEARV